LLLDVVRVHDGSNIALEMDEEQQEDNELAMDAYPQGATNEHAF
jgi:hypothetical protein